MLGTLIRTYSPNNDQLFYFGLVTEFHQRDESCEEVVIDVVWSDGDHTTEFFGFDDEFENSEFEFYHNGRWWEIRFNYYKFKKLMEAK